MRIGRRQDGRDRDGRLRVALVRVVPAWTKVVLVVHMGNSGCIGELSLMCLVMDVQGQRAVSANFRCLAGITGWMAVPFSEIRGLDKDQV